MTTKLEDLRKPFPVEEIEWRVQRSGTSQKGNAYAIILAYVDARAVQNRLDDVCGPGGWADEMKPINGGMICELAIKVGNEWIKKCDGSQETDREAIKGAISKALVRAASAWGIGRYLYRLSGCFADFVERGTEGAQRIEIGGQDYYWIPSVQSIEHLRAVSAQADATDEKMSMAVGFSGNLKSTESKVWPFPVKRAAAIASQRAKDPFAGTSIPGVKSKPTVAESRTSSGGGEYVIRFGKSWSGKRIEELSKDEMTSLLRWLSKNPSPTGLALECQEHLEIFFDGEIPDVE